jgi:hypothetical protein
VSTLGVFFSVLPYGYILVVIKKGEVKTNIKGPYHCGAG